MTNITNTLSLLNTLTEKNSFEVLIPSLKRNVKFKPLTTKQQKLFYSCLTDNVLYGTKFIIATYLIIKDNCYEPEIIDTLTVIDRLAILLVIRKNTLGVKLNLIKDNVLHKTSIESCLDAINNVQIPSNETIVIKNIKLELQTPLIADQYGVEKEVREPLINVPSTLNSAVQDAITGEVCKVIKNIWIIEEGTEIDVHYNTLTYENKIELIENLPAELLTEIQSYVDKINLEVAKLLTVPIDGDNIMFNITVDFFMNS
jgi:hypothetical protein